MISSPPIFDESLGSKVFNNPHLLEAIVSFLIPNCENNLTTRLINKSFNSMFLQLIRRSHRKMKIEFIGNTELVEGCEKDWIFINYRKIKKSLIPGYFRFLNKVVGVKVEEIITKNLWMTKYTFFTHLHDVIHSLLIGSNRGSVRKLIGLEEICIFDGCQDCANISRKCVEYGPLNFKVLQAIKHPIHYKRLYVSDGLLETIANYCTRRSTNKEGCFNVLDETILPSISCETLVLWINERRDFWENGVFRRGRFPIPREVLDVIIKKWNVNSIEIRMIYRACETKCNGEWLGTGYFTKFKFNDPYFTIDKSDKRIDNIYVNLSVSSICTRSLGYSDAVPWEDTKFKNFFPIIRRLFPTRKLSIVCSHWRYGDCGSLEGFMKNVLNVIQLEKQQKFEVDVQFFTDISKLKWGDSEENEGFAETPSEYTVTCDRFECILKSLPFDVEHGPERYDIIKWIGRRFQVKDIEMDFTLNLDIYVKQHELRELNINKRLIEKHPNSLIGLFM
ncbi:hypothetical protein GCK72_005253 [Caenorhabditis remanei]|uniref:Uncharacterized protein n=1 Tax=Caenorhabditis remanei TaxID=31234 RepID=A0A6A5HEH1_CAERE|nr:hypothetical protein GCK72_005253 [Caenorhabditis remanei]KAF1765301.1 hypothetical protein GCK72_005253 [Caenorhabditis remanei]